jgi:hypothetical protein
VCVGVCLCVLQPEKGKQQEARNAEQTNHQKNSATQANRKLPTEDAVHPQQAKERCAKEATNKPQTACVPVCATNSEGGSDAARRAQQATGACVWVCVVGYIDKEESIEHGRPTSAASSMETCT